MPLTVKQCEYLMKANHRWNVKTGATGSGKSFLDFTTLIPKRLELLRGEGLAVILGNTRGTLDRNIFEPMREWWPGMVSEIHSDNTIEIFGHKCYALGADNKKHVARIQGATFEYVYGDEITTWSEDVFNMLKSRLRCPHSRFDGTCNPAGPNHWFKKFLDSNADIYHQHYHIDDGALDSDIVARLKQEYYGTVYYQRYILGEWAHAEGMIYPMYPDALIAPFVGETYDEYVLSCDYGTQNAFAALLWARKGAVWYLAAEYRYSGRDTGYQKTDDDYVREIEHFTEKNVPEGRRTELMIIIDPSAASFIAAIRRSRYRYRVRKGNNDVEDGIRDTAVCMQRGTIRIFNTCKETIKEIEGYVWDDKAEDKPVKENDHMMDAMRYFVKTMRLVKPRETTNALAAALMR